MKLERVNWNKGYRTFSSFKLFFKNLFSMCTTEEISHSFCVYPRFHGVFIRTNHQDNCNRIMTSIQFRHRPQVTFTIPKFTLVKKQCDMTIRII